MVEKKNDKNIVKKWGWKKIIKKVEKKVGVKEKSGGKKNKGKYKIGEKKWGKIKKKDGIQKWG